MQLEYHMSSHSTQHYILGAHLNTISVSSFCDLNKKYANKHINQILIQWCHCFIFSGKFC